jgi:hypothetical protein
MHFDTSHITSGVLLGCQKIGFGVNKSRFSSIIVWLFFFLLDEALMCVALERFEHLLYDLFNINRSCFFFVQASISQHVVGCSIFF